MQETGNYRGGSDKYLVCELSRVLSLMSVSDRSMVAVR